MGSRAVQPTFRLPAHATRVQSPSSINMYKQCPRKYFYRYHLDLPTRPSIHLVRGSVTHLALEKFFDTDVTNVPDGEAFFFTMKVILNETLRKIWYAHEKEFAKLGLSQEQIQGFYDETKSMVNNYFDYFTAKIGYFSRIMPIKEAWEAVKPAREMEFCSEEHCVRGFMDAIHDELGKTIILDYKTSRRSHITPEYELQLSIYAMLYAEKFRKPDLVGIYFLKDGKEELLEVTDQMVDFAKREIMEVHLGTKSTEMKDYPKKPSALCKWATGQCDYYDYCWEGKALPDRQSKLPEHVDEQQPTI